MGGITYSSEAASAFEITSTVVDDLEYGLGILRLPPVVTKENSVCRFFEFGNSENSINNIIKTYGIPKQIASDDLMPIDSVLCVDF